MDHDLHQVFRDHIEVVAALKASVARTRELAGSSRLPDKRSIQLPLLLHMAEGLIAAHKVAKVDDDGLTLDLIEDALRHVGERLAQENADGRSFRRKQLRSLEP